MLTPFHHGLQQAEPVLLPPHIEQPLYEVPVPDSKVVLSDHVAGVVTKHQVLASDVAVLDGEPGQRVLGWLALGKAVASRQHQTASQTAPPTAAVGCLTCVSTAEILRLHAAVELDLPTQLARAVEVVRGRLSPGVVRVARVVDVALVDSRALHLAVKELGDHLADLDREQPSLCCACRVFRRFFGRVAGHVNHRLLVEGVLDLFDDHTWLRLAWLGKVARDRPERTALVISGAVHRHHLQLVAARMQARHDRVVCMVGAVEPLLSAAGHPGAAARIERAPSLRIKGAVRS